MVWVNAWVNSERKGRVIGKVDRHHAVIESSTYVIQKRQNALTLISAITVRHGFQQGPHNANGPLYFLCLNALGNLYFPCRSGVLRNYRRK